MKPRKLKAGHRRELEARGWDRERFDLVREYPKFLWLVDRMNGNTVVFVRDRKENINE